MRNKGLPEVIVKAVINETEVGSKVYEKFWMQVGVHQGSVLSPQLYTIAANVNTNYAREGLKNEILFVDDMNFMAESMKNLRKRFLK